jgi:hypothetical protein
VADQDRAGPGAFPLPGPAGSLRFFECCPHCQHLYDPSPHIEACAEGCNDDQPGHELPPGMPHGREWVRDTPHSCWCHWLWNESTEKWELAQQFSGCPWHTRKGE